MKTCSKCNETKDESEFHKNRATADGLHYYCKPCRHEIHREYYTSNIESITQKEAKRRKLGKVKRDANYAVCVAIRAGDLQPANERVCAICFAQAQDYHHESYKEKDWLKVVPLCRSCHRDLHCGNIKLKTVGHSQQ